MEALTPGSAGDLPPLGALIADVPFWRHACASGPFFSSSSSRARCCGLSRFRGTGPFDLSAPAPPSRQVLSYRRTDPSVTRRSCAISLIVLPRANRPAAPGRCCPAGACPPRCAYRISGHTPATSRRHDPSPASSAWLVQAVWRYQTGLHGDGAVTPPARGPRVEAESVLVRDTKTVRPRGCRHRPAGPRGTVPCLVNAAVRNSRPAAGRRECYVLRSYVGRSRKCAWHRAGCAGRTTRRC